MAVAYHARAAGEGLQASRRLLARLPADVHLARAVGRASRTPMKRYVLRRLALVVAMMRFMPGDVVIRMVEGQAYAPTVETLRKELGLDRPAYVQYLEWVGCI